MDVDKGEVFIDKLENHYTDYCKEHYDIECAFIDNKSCSNCKGLAYDHNLGCKKFLDGWTLAVQILTEFK